jgi:hypothetical protein
VIVAGALLMIVSGTIIALNVGGGVARLRRRRARWLGRLTEPEWFWRALGAAAAVSGVVVLVQAAVH